MTKATPAAIAVLRQATALRPKRKKASDGLLGKYYRESTPQNEATT